MIPAVVYYIFGLLVCAVLVVIVIPLCTFVFWHETRSYIIELVRNLYQYHVRDPQQFVMIFWAVAAVITGLYKKVISLCNLI